MAEIGNSFKSFFILFGFLFFIASIGFWKLGKAELAKAYVIPMIVAGALLLIMVSVCSTQII